MWGQAFICGSLGGMLFCGKTGFSAAHHHAPDNACSKGLVISSRHKPTQTN
ncbi:unnamed protein product, partial [Rotaria sordida]